MDKDKLIRSAVIAAAAGVAGSAAVHKSEGLSAAASNALFFGGIVLLVYALFQYALHLGFFSGVIYSFKKIVESFTVRNYDPKTSEIKSRPDYERDNRRGRVCREEFTVAGICLLLSLISAFL